MTWWNRLRHRRFKGVNLVGYARGGLGLGETLRRFAQALHGEGLPFSVVDVDLHLGDRGRDERLGAWISQDNPYPVNLLMVTASELPAVREHLGAAFFQGRRNVGYWFWELESFPAAWHGAFDMVDEAWTATEFVAAALRPHARAPVQIVPHPVTVPPDLVNLDLARRRAQRRELGVPEDGFQFLYTFDFHSYLARKNPLAAVEAFERAFDAVCAEFPSGQGVEGPGARLVLKSTNGHAAPGLHEALKARISRDPRITLIDRFLDHESHMRLMASCDAYVSLHRSEGFGQGMAEAMLLGKPVIATAYSGNLSFMNTHNSALVPAGRVALGPQDYPYGQGQQWAQPDLDAAAVLMRRAVRDPAWCAEMGRRARADVLQTNGPGVCARALRDAVLAMEQRA
jgi:glycosyltransferase involved in cell wall biosynthesis